MKLSIHFFALFAALFMFSCTSNSNGTDNTDNSDSTDTTPIDNSVQPTTTEGVTGTYTFGNPDDESSSGYLALELLEDDSVKFELNLRGAAPNYPTGTATGKMANAEGMLTFVTTEYNDLATEGDDECKITFTFQGKNVVVEQVNGSEFVCGFGKGVFANGTYKKVNDEAVFKYKGGM